MANEVIVYEAAQALAKVKGTEPKKGEKKDGK